MIDPLVAVSLGIAAVAWYAYRRRQAAEDKQRSALFHEKLAAMREASMHDSRSHERRPRDWKLRRDYVLQRDGHRCTRCQASSNLHVHHVVPVSRRIDHSVSNLVTLCVHCHAAEDGHGSRIVAASREARATRFRFDKRKARSDYRCAQCGTALPKGSITYVKRSEKVDGLWQNSAKRICQRCMLEAGV